MNTLIDITDVDWIELVKKVYDLSRPQGMGFMHYTDDPLTTEEAQTILNIGVSGPRIDMDYVKGRACKFFTYRAKGRLYMLENWYDHTDLHVTALLQHLGVDRAAKSVPYDTVFPPDPVPADGASCTN